MGDVDDAFGHGYAEISFLSGFEGANWQHVQGRTDATNQMEIAQRRSKLGAVAKDVDSAFSASLEKIASEPFHLAMMPRLLLYTRNVNQKIKIFSLSSIIVLAVSKQKPINLLW